MNRGINATMAALAAALLVITGCALSPQTVTIRPHLATQDLSGGSRPIWIEVRDTRQDHVLGYRGGVYDTAFIATAQDAVTVIEREVTAAYQALGYNVVGRGAPRANSLVIEIEQLKYTSRKNNLLWEIEIFAAVRARADSATREAVTNYQDRFTKEYAKAPSTQQNETAINEVFSRVLQRMLEDATVRDLLNEG